MSETNYTVVNKHFNFEKVKLISPTQHYYVQIAAEVDKSPFPFFLKRSEKKKRLIESCKKHCEQLLKEENAIEANVFTAVLIPPGRGKYIKEKKGPNSKFDFAVLIETRDAQALEALKGSDLFNRMINEINEVATGFHQVTATNVKRIGPVNHQKQGVFLFNYFFAEDLQQNLEVWEYTAGWFQQETSLDNSTVLLPTEPQKSDYAIINHCRWDMLSEILPSLLFKPSFRSYVLDNFYANKVAAVPVLYKLA